MTTKTIEPLKSNPRSARRAPRQARPRRKSPRPSSATAASFAHLLAGMPPVLRPDKVALVTGWSRRKIYELCEAGHGVGEPPLLESHTLPGGTVQRKQITRRSVAVFLLRTGTYNPNDFPLLVRLTLRGMKVSQLRQLIIAVEGEIKRHQVAAPSSQHR